MKEPSQSLTQADALARGVLFAFTEHGPEAVPSDTAPQASLYLIAHQRCVAETYTAAQ